MRRFDRCYLLARIPQGYGDAQTDRYASNERSLPDIRDPECH